MVCKVYNAYHAMCNQYLPRRISTFLLFITATGKSASLPGSMVEVGTYIIGVRVVNVVNVVNLEN